MIVIPRGLARSVRALGRQCVSGRPRGPAPPVVFENRAGTLTIVVRTADAALAHAAPTAGPDGVLVVPMAVLAAVEGPGDDPVELAVGAGLRGEARWAVGDVPRTQPFDALPPGKQHRPPAPPAHWRPAPPALLAALHECGRTAARAGGGRYALTRVQVRGSTGQVVGTDGKVALVWGGLALPVGADVLVPAVPVFGAKAFVRAGAVRVGRTADDVVVAAGPWRVHLPVDAGGKYPDVAAAVPRAAPTAVEFDARDAAELREQLAGLPGATDECRPVTLDVADDGVAVLGRDETSGRVEAVRLPRSGVTGPPVRVAVDRRVLARALALGCTVVRVAGPDRPVAFAAGDATLVAAALDPALVIDPAGDTPAAPVPIPSPERRTAMSRDPTGAPPDPPAADPPDLLTAAEDLRAAVADALTKAGRLVAALKSRRREQRVLSQVWSNLKSLNLGGGGGP